MGSREIERGPIGAQVSRNVAGLRRKRGMSLAQLSEAMEAVGRPVLPSGLGKVEAGERRVDVDDLVALALALGVSPVRLLLPVREPQCPEASEPTDFLHGGSPHMVPMTPLMTMGWQAAWEWASGDDSTLVPDRFGDWREENRPYAQPAPSKAELLRLAETARDMGRALDRAATELQQAASVQAGPPDAVTAYLTEQAAIEEERRG